MITEQIRILLIRHLSFPMPNQSLNIQGNRVRGIASGSPL
ncbi:hypothetical protein LEP1GSC065_0007 [Leptospira kirschneri serovar Sokoine str. RM1]|nr:hypothetical protein LEP1GSC065_0007 [Leptospira kirschneri serovar Sokoine str. RM1]